MSNPVIANLEALLSNGKDSALLRFGLGSEYMKLNDLKLAIGHLQIAVRLDPHYSAAWNKLGQALERMGMRSQALESYQHGIRVAKARGDVQASRAMEVFAARIQKDSRGI